MVNHFEMELAYFCKYTRMWEDDPTSTLAFVDYIDQNLPLDQWWDKYREDYL